MPTTHPRPPAPRSRRVTLFTVVVLMGVMGLLLRAGSLWQQRQTLETLPMTAPWGYFALSSLIWAVAFGIGAIGLWHHARWAAWFLLISFPMYYCHQWFDQFLFAANTYSQQATWFLLVSTVVSLILTAYVVWPLARLTQPPPADPPAGNNDTLPVTGAYHD